MATLPITINLPLCIKCLETSDVAFPEKYYVVSDGYRVDSAAYQCHGRKNIPRYRYYRIYANITQFPITQNRYRSNPSVSLDLTALLFVYDCCSMPIWIRQQLPRLEVVHIWCATIVTTQVPSATYWPDIWRHIRRSGHTSVQSALVCSRQFLRCRTTSTHILEFDLNTARFSEQICSKFKR